MIVNFVDMARQSAGSRWQGMTGAERRAAVRRQKARFLLERSGGEAERESYNEWLRAQPAAFQDEALGATRGRLFREGRLDIQKFTDPLGRPLTLAELARKRPEAFERAGLDPDEFKQDGTT